jgi:hypothetical protein
MGKEGVIIRGKSSAEIRLQETELKTRSWIRKINVSVKK